MSTSLVPLSGGALPTAFAGKALPDMAAAAASGLTASFPIISFKGKVWTIKYKGESDVVEDDRGAVPKLPVVIVGISAGISKVFYEKKYTEGADETPDCFSVNGDRPDPASTKPQCTTCAACPQNVFGSRVTDAGKKAKACQDSRRIAVVPLGDVPNESYGGPMLLRLPPMSLGNLDRYARELQRYNAQPFMVGTNLKFNNTVAYPEIEFETLGWVSNEQAAQVMEHIDSDQVNRMLNSMSEGAASETAASPLASAPPAAFAAVAAAKAATTGVPAEAAAPAAPEPTVAAAPATPVAAAPPPAAIPMPAPQGDSPEVAALKAQLAALQGAQTAAPAAPAAPAAAPAEKPKGKAKSPFAAAAAGPAQAATTQTAAAPVHEPAAVAAIPVAGAELTSKIDDLLSSVV